MVKHTTGFGARVRFARQRWGHTQTDLAEVSGLNVATVRRAELNTYEPRMETARKLADALCIRVEWLLTGDGDMIGLWHMTVEEQHRLQNGPEQGGLPGYVIVGEGPWRETADGDLEIDPAWDRERNQR